ncbi:hemicentin-1-like isoform X2 [Mercenaria mercenaria]|uniref:hemicentin-1-like isoform X2 n=1 Tax=Mercenaria mercenaria TaxID=6596 RepID=UPI00234EF087|nr:hemicentin-1-like isoform X2 [Mercenaria mercenaria]
MEFSDIHEKNQCDTSSINTTVLYENTGVRSVKQNESHKVGEIEKDEGHYEQLRLDSKPDKNKGISQEADLNRLKLVVYIMSALVLVLFIAVIVLIIVIAVPNGQVAGKWAQWSDWTSCDVTCGIGTHTRTRSCTNPAPAHGGTGCTGESTENKKCSEHFCPDGGWTNWGTWSTCTVTCGGGMQARTRT